MTNDCGAVVECVEGAVGTAPSKVSEEFSCGSNEVCSGDAGEYGQITLSISYRVGHYLKG